MDPKKDPTRHCKKEAAWPEADRRAWQAALQKGDVLEPGGAGAAWAMRTKHMIAKGYGRWLTWLEHNDLLEPCRTPVDRVTPERIAQYSADLRVVNAPYTVLTRVRELRRALRAMAPGNDWSWLRRVESRLWRAAVPMRNKRSRVVPPSRLFAYGLELIAKAGGPFGGTPLQRASRFRDGLMIALLAARPLRRRNFASIRIGRHLVRQGDAYWLRFEADETKTREPIEAPFPGELIPHLECYLLHHRPRLARRTGRWNRGGPDQPPTSALWVSTHGSAMTEIAIYFRIMKLTQAKFGHAVSPHLFRDSAATSIAINDPEHVLITRSILGHRTLRTSERHYNHAQSREALRRYQKRVLELRKQSHARDLDKRGARRRQEA